MKMIISNSSPIPIYEQIKNSIVSQIMSGELQEDEAIPSIRNLAQEIKISVMTIKKAYDELERDGFIIAKQGKGTFVAPRNAELEREQAKKEIEKYILKIVDISEFYGISKDEIFTAFNLFYGSDE